MISIHWRTPRVLAPFLFALCIAHPGVALSRPGKAAKIDVSQLTPEQRKVYADANSVPADQPSPKVDIHPTVKGAPNPNFGKVDATWMSFHQRFMQQKSRSMELLFLGDSITAFWSKAEPIWKEHYEKYHAANFGIPGDRTQHVLWRIAHGELDGISPKVVVLMIGTNNTSNYNAEQITAGITQIAKNIHAKLPSTTLLLLSVFPRGENGKSDAIREKLRQVNAAISKLDDGKRTRYLEIWNQFLDAEGNLSKEIMPDYLHPSPKGYQIWADAMQPTLESLMK